jgi:hypothetical protein
MTWADYARYSQGYWLRHSRRLEASRMIAYTLLQVNKAKGKYLPPPTQIWYLITDKEQEVITPISEDEFNLIAERYGK